MKRTGGEKTDEILGKTAAARKACPHSIIVTAEGAEGDAPALPGDAERVAPRRKASG